MPADPVTPAAKTYAMDDYDGGRAAAEPEHYRRSELGFLVRPRTAGAEEDERTLALAIIALTACR